ncbi:MAG TPA: GFA family protein [Stellaceae bacterium]|nr:GFA family protein [Stellaceae bacterium]
MADAAATTTGRCLCGAIRYAFEGPPEWVVHCHCESCRRQVSSPVATFVGVLDRNFRFTAGAPQGYASSPGVVRSFCAACGSPIAYRTARLPGEVHLFHGTLDDPDRLLPSAHVFTAERVAWFEVHDDLPRYAQGRRGTTPVGTGPQPPSETPRSRR